MSADLDLREALRRSPLWHDVLMNALAAADRAQARGDDEWLETCRAAAIVALLRIGETAPRRIQKQCRRVAGQMAADWELPPPPHPLPPLTGASRSVH